MKALSPSSRVRSSRRISSTCCESTAKPGRDGQSILATAATQTPRNSRTTGGGPSAAGVGAISAGEGAQPANHARARADAILDEVMTRVDLIVLLLVRAESLPVRLPPLRGLPENHEERRRFLYRSLGVLWSVHQGVDTPDVCPLGTQNL